MEKVCQESLVYQEKLFANKIPSLTMWCPWTLPPNQKILLHNLSVLKDKDGVHEFMYTIQCFTLVRFFKGTCLVIGRFLQDLKSRILKTTDFIAGRTIPRRVWKSKDPGKRNHCSLTGPCFTYGKHWLWVCVG